MGVNPASTKAGRADAHGMGGSGIGRQGEERIEEVIMLIWLQVIKGGGPDSPELFSADAITRTERYRWQTADADAMVTRLHVNSKSTPAVFVRESPEEIEDIIAKAKRELGK